MLHSVGLTKSNWPWRWLSMSLVHFENLCKYLSENGYSTHTMDEWYDYYSNNSIKDPKKIVLTFDDGYLDNWVFAYPILKKYGLKGTFFINTDFVDSSETIRMNLEDMDFDVQRSKNLDSEGFLNWKEIEFLDKTETVSIESHSKTHDFIFKSNVLKDLYEGQDTLLWVPWIIDRGQKPYYMKKGHEERYFGFPIFEYDRALGVDNRYIPNEKFLKRAQDCYSDLRAKGITCSHEILKEYMNLLQNDELRGRMESDKEAYERFKIELLDSKKELERHLKRRINHLCWPGGGFTNKSLMVAIESGYRTSTSGSKRPKSSLKNADGHKRVERFGLSSFLYINGKWRLMKAPNYAVENFKARTGNSFLRIKWKLYKELLKKLSK